jgi:hypothetical protein
VKLKASVSAIASGRSFRGGCQYLASIEEPGIRKVTTLSKKGDGVDRVRRSNSGEGVEADSYFYLVLRAFQRPQNLTATKSHPDDFSKFNA